MESLDSWKIQVFYSLEESINFKAISIQETLDDFRVSFKSDIDYSINDEKEKDVTVSFKSDKVASLEIKKMFGNYVTTKGADTLLEFKKDRKVFFTINKIDLKKSLELLQLI